MVFDAPVYRCMANAEHIALPRSRHGARDGAQLSLIRRVQDRQGPGGCGRSPHPYSDGFGTTRIAGCLLALLALPLLCACSLFSPDPPDAEALKKSMAATISVGWGWLHAENVALVHGNYEGRAYAASFEYDLVIDVDGSLLDEKQKERFAQFLPMCAHVPLLPGERCHLGETLLFVETEKYGWAPELAVRLTPDLLPKIAAWSEENP